MRFRLDTVSRRVAFAVVVSLLFHGLVLWGPNIRLPDFNPSLPQLTAKLEALPSAPARPRPKRKPRPAARQAEPTPAPEPLPQAIIPATSAPVAASEPAVASAPVETGTLATEAGKPTDRPPLPMHARLTFTINKGTSNFRIGEAIHTLDIDDGRYVLQATTSTVGIARLFKSYELDQYSSGRYGRDGLQPDLYSEERKERIGKQHNAVEFDHSAQRAHFSNGLEVALPPETQDILSVMYQFPPLAHTEIATVSVGNGKKIEHYQFEVGVDETIATPLGKMLTVHLHKMHAANEEGLDIWLAREYRLFPVKLRFTEKNGEVSGEAVITDIRVSEEEGVRKDVVN